MQPSGVDGNETMENLYDKDKYSYNTDRQQQIVERLFVLERHRQSRYWLVLLLIMATAVVVVYFTSPLIESLIRLGNLSGYSQNNTYNPPEVYKKVELLKGKMDALVTGSMETKVNRLEKNLTSGIIRPADLETIQGLKTDLQILRTYSEQNSIASLGMGTHQESIMSLNATSPILYSDELLHEISNLRSLFYLSIASCGFLIVVVSGAWLYSSTRLKQLSGSTLYRRALLDKPNSDLY